MLQQAYGYILPPKMQEDFGYRCKDISDHEHKELKSAEIFEIFKESYFIHNSKITVEDMIFRRVSGNVEAEIEFCEGGSKAKITAGGNGSLNAVRNALVKYTGKDFLLQVYTEHSLGGKSSESVAAAYIGISDETGKMYWGCGTNTDIIHAGVDALLAAYNNMEKEM